MKFAVIRTGGKQYKVSAGDTISIEKLDANAGDSITFDDVLLVAEDGKADIGIPVLEDASVKATVKRQYAAPKVTVTKYKPKIRYKRTLGHRQQMTEVEIVSV